MAVGMNDDANLMLSTLNIGVKIESQNLLSDGQNALSGLTLNKLLIINKIKNDLWSCNSASASKTIWKQNVYQLYLKSLSCTKKD